MFSRGDIEVYKYAMNMLGDVDVLGALAFC